MKERGMALSQIQELEMGDAVFNLSATGRGLLT